MGLLREDDPVDHPGTRRDVALVDVELPPLAEWDACCRVILQAEAYAIHERDLRTRPNIFARVTRERLLSGAMLSAADIAAFWICGR